jgi:MoaA/NifB/PqqE/SkfB family radical SAM enzyme
MGLWRTFNAGPRRFHRAEMVARALKSRRHPILAHIIPIRRCNLACAYCNEYDKVSNPVATPEMLNRIDLLAALGAEIITFSGGESLLHPDLDRNCASNGAVRSPN